MCTASRWRPPKPSPNGRTAIRATSLAFPPDRASATRGATAPAPTWRTTGSSSRFFRPSASWACSSRARSSSCRNRARRRSSCTIHRPSTMPSGAESAKLQRLLDPASIVVFDGAMGTMLYSRGVFINQCYDELNARAPDLVRDIHTQYVNAGADVIETNSFGANRLKLTQYGLQAQVKELNQAAAKVARE